MEFLNLCRIRKQGTAAQPGQVNTRLLGTSAKVAKSSYYLRHVPPCPSAFPHVSARTQRKDSHDI
jgi:hypothetical protein